MFVSNDNIKCLSILAWNMIVTDLKKAKKLPFILHFWVEMKEFWFCKWSCFRSSPIVSALKDRQLPSFLTWFSCWECWQLNVSLFLAHCYASLVAFIHLTILGGKALVSACSYFLISNMLNGALISRYRSQFEKILKNSFGSDSVKQLLQV